MKFSFTVQGITPAPQGSKRHLGNGVMIESCKQVKPWRYAVTQAAIDAGCPMFEWPVFLWVVFMFPRPKAHYKANGDIKESAPFFHSSRPDLSKLLRSTEDALTGVAYRDDSMIVQAVITKQYILESQRPGARITINDLRP